METGTVGDEAGGVPEAPAGAAPGVAARDVDDDAERVLHREDPVRAQPVDLEHHPHAVGGVLPGPDAVEDAVVHDDRFAEPFLDERGEQVDVETRRLAAPERSSRRLE